MLTPKISATIIALNEEKDLPRCLQSLKFCDEIILVDSGSTDKTAEIAKSYGAKVLQEAWRGYGQQKNFAMSHSTHEWVLNLDADEEVTESLRNEILREISSENPSTAYAIARKTFYLGKWIRFGGWYPNYVTRLALKSKSRWTEPNVHEELKTNDGLMPKRLSNPMHHYTFTDISDQIRTNLKYARQGAHDLFEKGRPASILKLIFKPIGKFFETYILKRGCLDGLAGFIISVNAAHSVFMKYSFLIELHREKASRK